MVLAGLNKLQWTIRSALSAGNQTAQQFRQLLERLYKLGKAANR